LLLTRAVVVASLLALPLAARAERVTTRDAFDRLEEVVELRQDDGLLDPREVLPAILVSARPRYQESEAWYGARALTALTRSFGAGTIRVCEACMRPRTLIEDGRLEQTTGPVSLDEIARFDDRYRGESARARTAVWLDETDSGVALRIVDMGTARVVFAQNVDPDLLEYRGSARSFTLSAELERRTRGESLTHAMFDTALYPGQHVSLEWADQWGENNTNLTGVVLGLYDPVFGIGASYHRALEWLNVTVGGQLILSIPTAVAQSQVEDGDDIELLDPLLTGVFVMRLPFGGGNHAILLTASTNGEVGLGLSFLNTTLIPVIP